MWRWLFIRECIRIQLLERNEWKRVPITGHSLRRSRLLQRGTIEPVVGLLKKLGVLIGQQQRLLLLTTTSRTGDLTHLLTPNHAADGRAEGVIVRTTPDKGFPFLKDHLIRLPPAIQ